ncbi:MAG: acyl-ACP--UDP-N-acetylglucosamine O-acyltransferase [Pseudomonadota bacterium]
MSQTKPETTIHPSAIVDAGAKLGSGVSIGPFCVVGPHVTLGDGCRLHAHVVVEGHTVMGEACEVFPFAVLGTAPQDLKFAGEESRLEIGARNRIREHVTMNPGTAGDALLTRVGSDGLFMVGSHVAHDCRVGNNVILANNATLAGHCEVGDFAILGGLSAVHQFVRIGAHAFLGGMSGLENDLIPYGVAVGDRAALQGLNIVGLKRRAFNRDQIHTLRNAYRLLFSDEGTLLERLADVEAMFGEDEGCAHIIAFIKARSDRRLCVPRSTTE